jgi:hypothetical protein
VTTPLADAEPDHLLNFIGYGRLDADIWFMGVKGAGGGGGEHPHAAQVPAGNGQCRCAQDAGRHASPLGQAEDPADLVT